MRDKDTKFLEEAYIQIQEFKNKPRYEDEDLEDIIREEVRERIDSILKDIKNIPEVSPEKYFYEAAAEYGIDNNKIKEIINLPSSKALSKEQLDLLNDFYGWVDQEYRDQLYHDLQHDPEIQNRAADVAYARRDPYGYRGLSRKDFY